LADFHLPSRNKRLFPLAISSAQSDRQTKLQDAGTGVFRGLPVLPQELAQTIAGIARQFSEPTGLLLNLDDWNRGEYRPVPPIIEAAQALYAGADVREIANSIASKESLTNATDALISAISDAESNRKQILAFVTGVPGAGKTLVGLNSIHNKAIGERGVFLSGNGPLVKILREALAEDQVRRDRVPKDVAMRGASVFIQNMHDFVRNHFGERSTPCNEHIIVFDEAQRAWNAEKNRKKIGYDISEPEIVLSIMDKVPDWAVVIALIGGGQEIHNGEAGLSEWGRAIVSRFGHWQLLLPREAMSGSEALAGSRLIPSVIRVHWRDQLHLPVSTRSLRSEAVTAWVNRVLEGDALGAKAVANSLGSYPIVISRSLEKAKGWLRQTTLGKRRFGLVGSSGASRLRAYGLETSSAFHRAYPFKHWFLKDEEDYRSSFQLEVFATEFEIQGLEIDRTCLCWGSDLCWNPQDGTWKKSRLRGTKWVRVGDPVARKYIVNKYRVLMTRSRDGMVIWIPEGQTDDPTTTPQEFAETADFLRKCGARSIDESVQS